MWGERSLFHEVGRLVRSGSEVWRVVPANHKLSLGFASGLMTLTSASNTVIALLLGWLSSRPTSHDPLGRLAEVRSTVEESLGDKAQPLIDAGRMLSIDEVVDLTSTELDAIDH